MDETTQILNTWNNIVKKISGKHIKKFIFLCCGNEVFDNNVVMDTVNDVILLKNSKEMIFCTYGLKNRSIVFDTSVSKIKNLIFKEIELNKYIITFFDGLYWMLNIETE